MNHQSRTPEQLKLQIAGNMVHFRKAAGLTQAELAQRIHYSDKAVSKWERAESLPDVLTLTLVARELNVTMDQLIYFDPEAPHPGPENPTPLQTAVPKPPGSPSPQKSKKQLPRQKKFIAALVTVLVWFLAILAFQLLSDFQMPGWWVGFVAAVPINALVLLVLLSVWGYYRLNQLMISTMMWGSLVLAFLVVLAFADLSLPKLFLLGIPGQLAIFLWFRMLHNKEDEPHESR